MYGTALIGSYLFMHGWALLFGGLPDEVEIVSRLQQHDRIKLKGEFTLYLAVLIGLFVLSVFIQKWGSTEKKTEQALEGNKSDSHVEMADDKA